MISNLKLKKLKLEDSSEIILSDIPHLFARCRKGKTLSITFFYKASKNKKLIKKTIGKYPAISLAAAREQTLKFDEILSNNKSLTVISDNSFGKLLDDFLNSKKNNIAATTYECLLARASRLRCLNDFDVQDITVQLFKELVIDKLEKENFIAFNHSVCNLMVEFYEYLNIIQLVENNPFTRLNKIITKYKPTHLKTIECANIDELRAGIKELFSKFKGSTNNRGLYATILLFSLLLRSNEVLDIKLENIDLDNKLVFIEKTKTIRDGLNVPLSNLAIRTIKKLINLRVVDNEYLISSDKTSDGRIGRVYFNELFNYRGIEINPHGVRSIGRNFFAFNEKIIPFSVAEMCLTHSVGNAVTRSYLRVDYFQERLEALNLFGDFILDILKELDVEI